MAKTVFYTNTSRNRAELGFEFVEEPVSGDPSLPWIAHDLASGRFAYVAQKFPVGHAVLSDWLA